jgi:hypothetical protein
MVSLMSSWEEAEKAIVAKIIELANAISVDTGSHALVSEAAAINHLAEARAWLKNPSQPHGGAAKASESS